MIIRHVYATIKVSKNWKHAMVKRFATYYSDRNALSILRFSNNEWALSCIDDSENLPSKARHEGGRGLTHVGDTTFVHSSVKLLGISRWSWCSIDHRPHSRQVTGTRCTGGRGSPVMSSILLKANNAQQASGVGDKRFFRFKRNVQHLWTAIIRHHVNDITHQQVMHFNNWSKVANIFEVHLKTPQCFGTLAQPFHFLPNTPVMTQWILTGPARVEWLWVNDFSHNEYHIWQAWPSTCWHVGSKLPKYEVPVFIAQTRNHWRKWKDCASVPKNGLPNWCD